jgi:hypothetical protein
MLKGAIIIEGKPFTVKKIEQKEEDENRSHRILPVSCNRMLPADWLFCK